MVVLSERMPIQEMVKGGLIFTNHPSLMVVVVCNRRDNNSAATF